MPRINLLYSVPSLLWQCWERHNTENIKNWQKIWAGISIFHIKRRNLSWWQSDSVHLGGTDNREIKWFQTLPNCHRQLQLWKLQLCHAWLNSLFNMGNSIGSWNPGMQKKWKCNFRNNSLGVKIRILPDDWIKYFGYHQKLRNFCPQW